MDNLEENQTLWKNTKKVFKNQFTQIEKQIAEARSCLNNLADPDHDMNGKEARKLIGPLQRKLELVHNYINSLHTILPKATGPLDDGIYSVDNLSTQLDECMERAKIGNQELTAFVEAIEDWEVKSVTESKPGGSGKGEKDTKGPELKGVASALKPEELTSSIAAQDMSLWVEQWNEYKENSAFSKQGEKSIIAYLKTCVSRDILSAIDYKRHRTEQAMLNAIQAYLDTKVHPKIIRQLEIWRAKQADGTSVAETMRRQVCQFYDTSMENNTIEDWLRLLLYTTCQDKELLSKVLAKARTLNTAQEVINYVEAEECGKLNAERLLGGKEIAARLRGQQGDSGGSNVRCFACQGQGHSRPECTVDKS